MNAHLFEEFISWAKNLKLRGKSIGNRTINKMFVPLKMICKQAAIAYQWGNTYDPFFGYKNLPVDERRDDIIPFSLDEQKRLRRELPEHWRPYFDFAFRAGVRQGEQIALKPHDVDWARKRLHIERAMTLAEDGSRFEGTTKNKYSRRTIRLTPGMLEALEEQRRIHDRFGCEYFFCTENGCVIDRNNLRQKIWIPALKRAGVRVREMKQTRHTFATVALSCGENPLWIAKVLGHRDAEMVIKVYSRYVEDLDGSQDGMILDSMFQRAREVTEGKYE